MKRMTQKDYARNRGCFCPFCKSDSVYTEENGTIDFLKIEMKCDDCKKKFTELHQIKGYTFK